MVSGAKKILYSSRNGSSRWRVVVGHCVGIDPYFQMLVRVYASKRIQLSGVLLEI